MGEIQLGRDHLVHPLRHALASDPQGLVRVRVRVRARATSLVGLGLKPSRVGA